MMHSFVSFIRKDFPIEHVAPTCATFPFLVVKDSNISQATFHIQF